MNRVTLRFLVCVLLALGIQCASSGQSVSTGAPGSVTGFSRTGLMFDVEAMNTVVVDSLDIEVLPFGLPDEIEIWTTKDGSSHIGKEEDPHAWELLATVDLTVALSNPPVLGVWIPTSSSLDSLILAGSTRGFYVTAAGSDRIKGLNLPGVGVPRGSDGNVTIRGGSSVVNFQRGSSDMLSVRVHYTTNGLVANDLRTNRIVTPDFDALRCDVGAANTNVSVELLNVGTGTIVAGTVIPIDLTVDEVIVASEFAVTPVSIMPLSGFAYTFTTPADFSSVGQHVVQVSHSWISDQNVNDNILLETLFSGGQLNVSQFPYFENFDLRPSINLITPPNGWTHEPGDPQSPFAEWQFASNNDFAGSTRPNADHTTGVKDDGYFCHTNDQGHFPNVGLRSPCFDFTSLSSPQMSFWFYSDTVTPFPNELHIDVIDMSTSQITLDVIPAIGVAGPQWTQQLVDLTAFSGKTVRIVFRATTNHPSAPIQQTNHEFAIDDVAIFEHVESTGQAPQPGFATFRIGTTLNASFIPLESLAQGPYFSAVNANDSMLLEFSGEPMMPVLLFTGPLNPQAATFPVIGSVDLGGAPDPISGIPSDLLVLGDGDLSTGINPYFHTGFSGTGQFGVSIPNIPPGFLIAMQCVIRTSGANGSYIALSNAIVVIVE